MMTRWVAGNRMCRSVSMSSIPEATFAPSSFVHSPTMSAPHKSFVCA